MNTIYHIPSDGLELAAETFGQGEPLVFGHGLTGNRHITRKQMMPLADRHTIIIYDQRGHCDSTPVTDPALYDRERMGADLGAVLDYFHVDRAILGGESMGAATTLTYAVRHPERVKTLLITAPAFSDEPNAADEGVRAMGREILDLGMEGYLENSRQRLTERGVPALAIATIRSMQSSHQPESLATACLYAINWVMPEFAELAKLDVPACVIGWENDLLHPFALAERLVATLPRARLETLPSLGTLFMDPACVGRIYRSFLESLG